MIADDHSIVRHGLKQIVNEEPDMQVVCEAESGAEALAFIQKDSFDAVVLDITMPGRSGLDILKDIKQLKPKLPVLILSMYPEDQYGVRVIRAGAAGYLSKRNAVHELINAIRKIVNGGRFISPELAEHLAFDVQSGTDKPLHTNLSDREFQILCMLGSGKTVGEIAEELSLSTNTISTYRSRLLEKMNMKTNAELTLYVVQNKLQG